MNLPLFHALGQEVAQLINTALGVEPPGGLPATWQRLLIHYGIEPLPESERFAEIQRQKQSKGAPVSEVVACLQKLQHHVLGQLQQVPHLDEATRAAVHQALEHLVTEGSTHYQKLAYERPKGMFAHVKAIAHQHQYAQYKPGAYVLLCPTCGGPRLNPSHLHCEYCSNHFSEQS